MFRLAHGQSTLQYLRANVAIVALEGNLKLSYCDHALAWLSGITPVWITVHEGERFVLPHRGIVSISAASAGETAFAVQPLPAQRRGPCAMLRAASRVSRLVRRLRRRSSQR
ncbi:hypothetical protein [Burkholderia ambifaria]|uniref:hypothetical protein n=1 Tax=Burkholderia ambifaria TaxID=152480 RepID=UPI001591C1C9|nr:hypothetical protein [Burkholderia ambifaria]